MYDKNMIKPDLDYDGIGHNARIILKLIGQDAAWTLDTSNADYTRRSIFKLAK